MGGKEGMKVRMVMWPCTCDFGLSVLVLDTKSNLATFGI